MTVSPSLRPDLKADLLECIGYLDRAEALLPTSHPEIDQLIQTLEAITPIAVENEAVVSLPLVGELTATAKGFWQPYEEMDKGLNIKLAG
jgi:hypothetical protein